ncbi:hypothetical protein HN018_19575 [Lichenicola cladoniae]|uniref:Uncharacterized protein n=1 Tax=Lichenicola cladoniae TaxID=1484109 RepID=A0A6M8HTT9_9PROT|nr:hypothetical protein [Lichenicola cladoniae]NPD66062.1 hypothetical protein [Acetobacteraceae bacterium]QKE91939.1 hypothetical protein HN018_19575 [Lichenicola cladoniae]
MSAMLTGRDRERLIKVLSLLASDQDGERAAAGWTAARMLRDRGLDWNSLIPAELPAPRLPERMQQTGSQNASASVWSKEIAFLLRRSELLTDYEKKFVRSVATRPWLTPKQVDVLSRTYDRIMDREVGR